METRTVILVSSKTSMLSYLILLLFLNSLALGDTVKLHDGRTLTGDVLSDSGSHVKIKTDSGGILNLPKSRVASVVIDEVLVDTTDPEFLKELHRRQDDRHKSQQTLIKSYNMIDHLDYKNATTILTNELKRNPMNAALILPFLSESLPKKRLDPILIDIFWKLPPEVASWYYPEYFQSSKERYKMALSEGESSEALTKARAEFAAFLNPETNEPYPIEFLHILGENPKSEALDAYVILSYLDGLYNEAREREDTGWIKIIEEESKSLLADHVGDFERCLVEAPSLWGDYYFSYVRDKHIANFRKAMKQRDIESGKSFLVSLSPYGIDSPASIDEFQERCTWTLQQKEELVYTSIRSRIQGDMSNDSVNSTKIVMEYLIGLLTEFPQKKDESSALIAEIWMAVKGRLEADLYAGIQPGSLLKSLDETTNMLSRSYPSSSPPEEVAELRTTLENEKAAQVACDQLRSSLTSVTIPEDLDPIQNEYELFKERWEETIAFERLSGFQSQIDKKRSNMLEAQKSEEQARQRFLQAVTNKTQIERMANKQVEQYLERKRHGFSGGQYWAGGTDKWTPPLPIYDIELPLHDYENFFINEQEMSCYVDVVAIVTFEGNYNYYRQEVVFRCNYDANKSKVSIEYWYTL